MAKKLYHTNFSVAVNWCNNALVMCNNLPEIDSSVWDNMMPVHSVGEDDEEHYECPECGEEIQIHACIDSDGDETGEYECEVCGHIWDPDDVEPEMSNVPDEIFQWFITDCSKFDVNYLREHFGLLFTYSNLLDCYILCITHYGTAWDYVDWETDNPNAERKLGEKK